MEDNVRGGNGSVQTHEEIRSFEQHIRPAVNIIETESGLTLTADVPGATRENLEINVEKGILTITAAVTGDMPGTSVYREFQLADYYRQFSIPEVLDHERAEADLTNGILTLKIPKREAAKPRKIEIKVG